ncbi:putative peptide chain release factor 1-like, mitochondrial-like [Capsicum annuum]|nr:putative peptide chain release factor 1-like, mitochondrial-like [Capsicum annuum]
MPMPLPLPLPLPLVTDETTIGNISSTTTAANHGIAKERKQVILRLREDLKVGEGTRRKSEHGVGYSRVVRSGVPRGGGGRRNHALTGLSFLFIILGTATQGGANIARYADSEL